MKSLAAGIVLILVLGIGGFIYRNVLETTGPEPVACTMEAKICPDGSSVGRTAPACEFAPCPFPNVEYAPARISFVAPPGYAISEQARGVFPGEGNDFLLLTKPSLSEGVPHTISVRSFDIPEGQTADDVILAHTRYQPADMQAEDFSRFSDATIGSHTFRYTVIERFEALVQSAYFLPRAHDVIVFEVVEHDVASWMDADLNTRDLPEHSALAGLLLTLQEGQ